ncbi:MAG: sel1 repeat family protein [Pseudomonadales bacterium]|nr:sel1 repeat family protein [Pseudomonadales bacterium]
MTNMRMLTIILLLASSFRAIADIEAASHAYRNNDYASAFKAFTELAKNGDARSQTILAMMYKYGESTAVDLEQSFHWYLEAALQGQPSAQYNVGIMLIDGEGVTKDTEAAKEWLSRAVNSGHLGARDKLSALTGEATMVKAAEPIEWSRNWNFRLPNDIRFLSPNDEVNHDKTYRIQLGAMSSITGAEQLWRQAFASSDLLLEGFDPVYQEGISGFEAVWRGQAGSFSSESSASDFCSRYKANPRNKTGCIVVRD